MKALLVFLACLIPLTTLLWLAASRHPDTRDLPDVGTAPDGPPVLVGSDFANAYGETAFAGTVRRLDDVAVRVMDHDYVHYYLRFDKLERSEAGPQLTRVSCAVFDPPRDGKPRLRLTLHAPRITGTLPQLVRDPATANRTVRLEGGVVVRDPQGRKLAEVDAVEIDVDGKTLRSEDVIALRLPDQQIEVRGQGFRGDVGLRSFRLLRKVEGTVRRDRGQLAFSAAGPALVSESDDALRLTMTGGARIEHDLGTTTCSVLTVLFEKRGSKFAFAWARLEGQVRLELDTARASGLETIRLESLVIDGSDRMLCRGLTGVRRGKLAPLGLGERTIDLAAPEATILLREGALEEIRFTGGFEARDRAGPAYLRAQVVTFTKDSRRLDADGAVELKTADAFLRADRVRATAGEKDRMHVEIEGVERIEHVADGQLGPLGATRGKLVVVCDGTVRVDSAAGTTVLIAQDRVVATVGPEVGLEGDEVGLTIRHGELLRFTAAGHVWLRGRGVEGRGARLVFEDGEVQLTGTPVTLLASDRTIRARELRYREDRHFVADGQVYLETRLGSKDPGTWKIRCGRAEGQLGKDKQPPVFVKAFEGVRVEGPLGELIEGVLFRFVSKTGVARLEGSPARVRRAQELAIAAPALDLTIRENELVAARTEGQAFITYAPSPPASIRRWDIKLNGPAVLDGLTLQVPAGAALVGFDEKNKPALRAEAGTVQVDLERTAHGVKPKGLQAAGGVVVSSNGKKGATVKARRLRYAPGSNRVDIFDRVQVTARGWPREVRFKHVVFVLGKDGIDLKRASEIEVFQK